MSITALSRRSALRILPIFRPFAAWLRARRSRARQSADFEMALRNPHLARDLGQVPRVLRPSDRRIDGY